MTWCSSTRARAGRRRSPPRGPAARRCRRRPATMSAADRGVGEGAGMLPSCRARAGGGTGSRRVHHTASWQAAPQPPCRTPAESGTPPPATRRAPGRLDLRRRRGRPPRRAPVATPQQAAQADCGRRYTWCRAVTAPALTARPRLWVTEPSRCTPRAVDAGTCRWPEPGGGSSRSLSRPLTQSRRRRGAPVRS